MALASGRIVQVNVKQLVPSDCDQVAAAKFMPANPPRVDRYAINAVEVFDYRTRGSVNNARMKAADKS
jgi:hypothetical protein